ncbi:MAG TPA: hypothetical protein VNM69_04645 [Bacillus sp. (in: firmicutes)]|uniref:hypothetical protein n=1 Tax=Bacillus litorisediminis TaxID=2922713 RepID=UPI001FAF5CE6|nr:hypothetical protein [Bacillus litorisediminis]HWO75194.1 hypothetical protein [Bacillus sp. (in: firmicutes)]
MIYILIVLISFICLKFYNRYVPIYGVKCSSTQEVNESTTQIIDVRDYNQAYKDPVHGSINIPIAYLKRYHHQLKKHKLFIVASSPLEKNLSIRYLKRRGYKILGYRLTDCKCKESLKRTFA